MSSENNQARPESEPLLGRPGDVTQKAEEGLQWNLVTGTAVVAQAGTWILAALVWSAVFEAPFSFFSYHPVSLSAALVAMLSDKLSALEFSGCPHFHPSDSPPPTDFITEA